MLGSGQSLGGNSMGGQPKQTEPEQPKRYMTPEEKEAQVKLYVITAIDFVIF